MSAPTNVSFATATDLGTLPATVSQRVDDSGTTYTVFYKFTAPSDATVIGAFGFGDLTTYKPTIQPFNASQVGILSISVQNKPIQFPVTASALYYLKLVTNGGNPTPANLTLNVQAAGTAAVPVGSIAVTDDTAGFPIAFISDSVSNSVLRFRNNVVAGESGDTLSNGTVLLEDASTGNAVLYDSNYTTLATITLASGSVAERGAIRTCTTPQKFYVGTSQNPPKFCTVSSTGTVSAQTTLTGSTSLKALAASNDESVLYHAGGAGAAIERWDITGGVALTDLVAGFGAYAISDIIVLLDGTILVGYFSADYIVKRYSTAGATLNTYSFPAWVTSTPRIATEIDDPLSFWVMAVDSPATLGTRTFTHVRVSDGTTLETVTGVLFSAGGYTGSATATPTARFGTSPSCPFWIVRSAQGSTGTSGRRGIYVPTRGDAGSEGGGAQARFQDLNGFPSTSTGFSSTVAGRIIPILAGAEGRRAVAQPGGAGSGRAIYVPTVGIAGAEGDGRISTLAQLAIRRIVVYDGEGYTHR